MNPFYDVNRRAYKILFLVMLRYKVLYIKLYCKGCLNSNENKVNFMTVKYYYK